MGVRLSTQFTKKFGQVHRYKLEVHQYSLEAFVTLLVATSNRSPSPLQPNEVASSPLARVIPAILGAPHTPPSPLVTRVRPAVVGMAR